MSPIFIIIMTFDNRTRRWCFLYIQRRSRMSIATFGDRSKRWVSHGTAVSKIKICRAAHKSTQNMPRNWDARQFCPQICRPPPLECLFVCKASCFPKILLIVLFLNLDTFSLHSFNFVKMIQSLIWTNAKSLNLRDQSRVIQVLKM